VFLSHVISYFLCIITFTINFILDKCKIMLELMSFSIYCMWVTK